MPRKNRGPQPGRVTPEMAIKVIERCAMAEDSQEKRLWLSVIATAVKDSRKENAKHECEYFFNSSRFEDICDLVGLSAQATLEIISKVGTRT